MTHVRTTTNPIATPAGPVAALTGPIRALTGPVPTLTGPIAAPTGPVPTQTGPIAALAAIAERGIDRRQILKAGAWIAPVILLATAAPAAAASVTDPAVSAAVIQVNGVVFQGGAGAVMPASTGQWQASKLVTGSFDMPFEPKGWGVTPPPAALAVSYTVELVEEGGSAVHETITGTRVLTDKKHTVNFGFARHLALGKTYTFRIIAIAEPVSASGMQLVTPPAVFTSTLVVTT